MGDYESMLKVTLLSAKIILAIAVALVGSSAYAQMPPSKQTQYGDWTYTRYSYDNPGQMFVCRLEAVGQDHPWRLRFVNSERYGLTLLLFYPKSLPALRSGETILVRSATTEVLGVVDVVLSTDDEAAYRMTPASAKALQAMLSDADTVTVLAPGTNGLSIAVKGLVEGMRAVDGCTDR